MTHTRQGSRCGRIVFVAALVLTGLAACTNGKFDIPPVIDIGMDIVGLGTKNETPLPEPATSIGPPLVVGYQAVRVAIPNTGTSGQSRVFVSPDGVEITMNNGHVTRVIGIGSDLKGMFLPVESPYAGAFVQAAREKSVTERIADYFVKRKILNDGFRCTLNYIPREGTKGIVIEQCRRFFGGPGFRNTYWTEGDRIVCSLQWFHPEADHLQLFETAQQAQTLDLNEQGC